MKLIKLTALSSLFFVFVFGITSCEKNAEKKKTTDYEKKGIVLSGAQETPANPTTALGTMDVFYTKETRILTYTINWSGLTGAVSAMHIHGLAPSGFPAGVVQSFTTANIVRCPTTTITSCGSYQGTLLADGVAVKEDDILNGVYYVNIHTATYPGGEIRGQVRFQ
jgi:hypothetical protein